MSFIEKLNRWTRAKLNNRLRRKYGMIRQCPWCLQTVETGGKHKMRTSGRNAGFDTFTCGNCGGESDWMFAPAPIYCGPGKPPEPKFKSQLRDGRDNVFAEPRKESEVM